MLTVIKRDQLQDLDHLINNLPIERTVFNKIVKYRNRISRRQNEHYKYGSSWLDFWFLKRDIRLLNKQIKKYAIAVIL